MQSKILPIRRISSAMASEAFGHNHRA